MAAVDPTTSSANLRALSWAAESRIMAALGTAVVGVVTLLVSWQDRCLVVENRAALEVMGTSLVVDLVRLVDYLEAVAATTTVVATRAMAISHHRAVVDSEA